MFHFYRVQKDNTGLKWVKEPLLKVLRNMYCLRYFGILRLEPRWICQLRFIAYFCCFMILCFGTSFRRLEIIHLAIKIQPQWRFAIYHVPKIIAYLIERAVLFLYPSSFPIHYSGNINSWVSYYKNIVLLAWYVCWYAWYVSCTCELFSVILIVFAINNFHKQLYVKDS